MADIKSQVRTSAEKEDNKARTSIKECRSRRQVGRHTCVEKIENFAPAKKPDGKYGDCSEVRKKGPKIEEVSFRVGKAGAEDEKEDYEFGVECSRHEKKAPGLGKKN